ncbi:hypothetical protein [Mariprofundus ferrooxydans]|nr:hypothetical protein [Mariprofundus ferrooxydans]
MDRFYQQGTDVSPPVPPVPGETGYPRAGVPGGASASVPGAYWFHMITESLRNLVLRPGMTPDHTNLNLVADAIESLVDQRAGNFTLDTGIADAYVIALDPVITANVGGMVVRFKAGNTCTGPSTLDAGAGPVPIVSNQGAAMQSGDIVSGSIITALYDATSGSFMITTQVPSQTSAMPPGIILSSACIQTPPRTLSADGGLLSRTGYANLWAAQHLAVTGDCSAASAVISNIDTTNMQAGWNVGGTYFPAGTTILSIDIAGPGGQLTVSANATGNGVGTAFEISPWGLGDGATTFNKPEVRNEFVRFADDGRGVNVGSILGSVHADSVGPHTHPTPIGGSAGGSSGFWGPSTDVSGPTDTGSNTGTETQPHHVVLHALVTY